MSELEIEVGTTGLSEKDHDIRDYIAGNILKDIPETIPDSFMHKISKTYRQHGSECTAFSTTHAMQIQNEKEFGLDVTLDPIQLFVDMGHPLGVPSYGDSIENAVKTAVKKGIRGTKSGSVYNFSADVFAYGKWDKWKQVCCRVPLLTILYGNSNTWREMFAGEVKTNVPKTKNSLGHAVCICGYDKDYVYFYNSFKHNDGEICKFKILRTLFASMITSGMVNRRWFCIIDRKEMKDFSKERELSKQAIDLFKKLYSIGDTEVKGYLEKIGLSAFFEKKYGKL